MSLRIRHDTIRRGRRVVLAAGEIETPLPAAVAIVGANGSGKTTLLMHVTRTLAAQRTPATVLLRGREVRAIGYVAQSVPLPAWLRARDAAALFRCNHEQLSTSMPGLHLEELWDQRIGVLSPGQRQALAVAFALGGGSDMLVLDEPFSSIDLPRRLGALELLHAWLHDSPDRALLLSSQQAPDLLDLCTHFVVLRDGRYVFNDSHAALASCVADECGTAERKLVGLMTR